MCTELTDPEAPGTLEDARNKVEQLCGLVDAADSSFLDFLSGGLIARANENCKLAKEALLDGRVDDALEISGNTCDDVLDEVQVGGESQDALKRLQVRALQRAGAIYFARINPPPPNCTDPDLVGGPHKQVPAGRRARHLPDERALGRQGYGAKCRGHRARAVERQPHRQDACAPEQHPGHGTASGECNARGERMDGVSH